MPKMTVAQKREFLVEMCNCREYLKTDVELNKAVLKKHLKFLPQQKLYKFRACIEREFRMLEENCIWMSLASSFPDPFDHTINIDLVKNRREVKEWLGKNGSSLCFEVVKRLFEEKGLAIPYTFSDFEDYMKTCLDENGIPIKDRERAFLAAHATPDELSQMDSIIQQLVCARKRFASIEEQMTKILVPINSQKALRSYKSSLKDSLSVLKLKRDAHPELFESDGSGDSSKKTFLDALYEEGIIPTYSFPKNVVSTYISGIDGKVKYQVERGLDVAIGEYAPGRAIVVDKTTYQIGGLYYPGGGRTEQTAYSPARAFIQDASYCKNISTCTECGWFGLDEDHPHKCPFCGNDKLTHMLPMLRPWGFAPRDAKAIEQAQLSEEYTATQQPLYSTLPDADDVVAIKGYSNTRMAVRPNQRIIMLNKGIGDKGFTICCDCGAAMPGDDPSVLKDIMRPYRSKFLRTRCKHNETKNVNLGYDFITDMLVLEIALDRQQVSMDLAKNSWLNRAGQSLAEALRLSACQELDIEFTELVTGFRVRQNQKGDFIDIYLYDSLSSGAGYAVSIEASIQQLLIKTRELLSSCNCDSACHKCLKHYRNQYVHGLLDRSAALDLLTWAEKGVRSPMLPVYEQRNLLQSVEQILQFSGVHIDFDHEPIEAESFHGKKRIVVYPAMWARPTEKNMVFVSDSYLKYAKPYALKTIVDGL